MKNAVSWFQSVAAERRGRGGGGGGGAGDLERPLEGLSSSYNKRN